MKKKPTLLHFPSAPSKEYETGLDKLLVSESHEIDWEAEAKARAEADKQIGKWIEIDPKISEAVNYYLQTGKHFTGSVEAVYPTKQFNLISQIKTGKTLLESIEASAKEALKNQKAPEHVHGLAKSILNLLHNLGDDLKDAGGKCFFHVWPAFYLGQTYERLLLWENEQPAQSGKRSRAAAQRKGRAAPVKSLRHFFETHVADWQKKSHAQLLIVAKNNFKEREQDNLSRQIRNLKKGGQ